MACGLYAVGQAQRIFWTSRVSLLYTLQSYWYRTRSFPQSVWCQSIIMWYEAKVRYSVGGRSFTDAKVGQFLSSIRCSLNTDSRTAVQYQYVLRRHVVRSTTTINYHHLCMCGILLNLCQKTSAWTNGTLNFGFRWAFVWYGRTKSLATIIQRYWHKP